MMQAIDAELKARLNSETGKLEWSELQRHFARGVVLVVAPQMDLIEVAAHMSCDDAAQISAWLDGGQIHRASEEDARRWVESEPLFWAVVVAPWVVVQEFQSPLNS